MDTFLSFLKKYFKLFIGVYLAGFLIAILLFITLPRRYKATAEIMPSLEPELMMTLGSALTSFNPLVSMMISPADILARVLYSRAVLYPVIDSLDLRKKLKSSSYVKVYRKLLKSIEVKAYMEGIVEVSYEDKDPYFAAQLVNTIVRELDHFNRFTVMTKGRALREFLELRLKEEEELLAALKDSLQDFQKKYGTMFPEQEYGEFLKSYYEIVKNYLLAKAERDLYKVIYYENSPAVKMKSEELKVYEKQLSSILGADVYSKTDSSLGAKILNVPMSEIPEFVRRYFDLVYRIEAHKEVYKFLFSKYEEAKILEKKDTPTFTVMRYADVPDYKSFPRGTHLVLYFFLLSTLFNIVIFVLKETNLVKMLFATSD